MVAAVDRVSCAPPKHDRCDRCPRLSDPATPFHVRAKTNMRAPFWQVHFTLSVCLQPPPPPPFASEFRKRALQSEICNENNIKQMCAATAKRQPEWRHQHVAWFVVTHGRGQARRVRRASSLCPVPSIGHHRAQRAKYIAFISAVADGATHSCVHSCDEIHARTK